ncbi:MAG: hypothetical protein WKF94_19610 [Solirubrobacteraceae bacterium]
MAADRRGYGERQAQLLSALVAGRGFPDGFAADKATDASRSLRRKRGRAVAKAWPALALALRPRFDERFDAFARGAAAPASGGALADGLAFAWTLDRGDVDDDARVEVLFARARLVRRAGVPLRRRSPFVGAIALHEPRRLLVVVRFAPGGLRSFVLRTGRR